MPGWINLGFSYFNSQEYAAAERASRTGLRLQPHAYDALFGLALTQSTAGHRPEAFENWRKYLAEAPEAPRKERARRTLAVLEGQ